ncbi:hypothetical protein FRC14_004894 [Serendipita sp. 396]|nr:hypothetical protein FRC14_004894 [Serendipita sp. 396]KAG8802723.1 hypothetical protein FRC16_008842 [Serendipita sp. 398]
MLWVLLLQVLLVALLLVRADVILTNYTLDDNDDSIEYSGDNWEQHASPLNFGGSHMVGEGADAQVVFTFTGVSVYYLASLWRYEVDSYVSLDEATPSLVNLTASPDTISPPWEGEEDEVALWDVRWSETGLENTTHTVTITQGTSGYVISDGFRFTVPVEDGSIVGDPPLTSTTQQGPSPTTSESTPLGDTSTSDSPILLGNTSETIPPTSLLNPVTSESKTSKIVIATLASILGTLFIVGVILCIRWNRRRRDREPPTVGNFQTSQPTSAGPVNNNFTSVVPNVVIPPGHGWQETAAITAMPTGASSSTDHSVINYHSFQPNGSASQNPHAVFNPQPPMAQVAIASQSITTLSPLTPSQ